MKAPIVSVIIPAYRCEATIAASIESALMQDVDLEVLVVNNDKNNKTLTSLLHAYDDRENVHIIVNEENIGAAKGRNLGVKNAKGRYIAFLDSDDMWTEGKLKEQLALLAQSNAPICCTARELISPDGSSTGRVIPVTATIAYHNLLSHNSINCSSVLLPREIALEFPMEYEEAHEEYITWLRIVKKYGPAVGINKPMLKYRLSDTGKSGSKLQSAKMTYQVYRYVGYNTFAASLLFLRYAAHGVLKYLFAEKKC